MWHANFNSYSFSNVRMFSAFVSGVTLSRFLWCPSLITLMAEDNTISTKPLISKQQSHTWKAKSYNPNSIEWINAAIEVKKNWKEEKFPTISYTQHRTISIPFSILTKRKNGNKGKKRIPHWKRNRIRKIKNRLNKLN